jgi:alkanesulfonate monooxygenase SsuD/methylene tetrahydromethanopterin reductase-like flavin-dependent oxidoreductase (luciferase family)
VLIMPYRHPALTAQVSAGLHRLGGGRFVLGVGIGWARKEFAQLGIPFERRGALTDEYLAAMRNLWDDEVDGVAAAFTPDEQPGPPIWIGGNSDAGVRRAVRVGDAWHPAPARVHDAVDRASGAGSRHGAARHLLRRSAGDAEP